MSEEATAEDLRARIIASQGLPPWVMATLGLLAVSTLIAQHGFPISTQFSLWLNWCDVALAIGFGAGLIWEIMRAPRRREVVRRRTIELFTSSMFLVSLGLVWLLPEHFALLDHLLASYQTRGDLGFALLRLFLLANVAAQLLRSLQYVFALGFRVELLLAGSFAALILVGTLLLVLPRAAALPNAPITLTEAFFTATSAACVTGLVVRDTGTDFSTLGQLIILVLFQVGGLGVVTFVAFISAFSSKTLPVPQMVAIREMISAPAMENIKSRISGILQLTAVIELVGIISLYPFAPGGDPFERLKWSVFHTVSAFCNAGFALHANSLEFARTNVGINLTIAMLIVLGGLGFLVLPELLSRAMAHLRRLPLLLRPSRNRFLPPAMRLTVQCRISLWVTLGLVVAATSGFWGLEARHLLAGYGMADSFLTSLFQSITIRTAGFNTVPIGDLQQATLIFLILFMIIGGCPVSTAGGIKTVTFGILLLALRSLVLKKRNVEAFGRTLPPRAFFTALNVFVLYTITASIGVFLLAVFDPQIALRDSTFEVISALSTVGLSTGITAGLSTPGKMVLCVAMFIGRVGPIALVLSVFQSRGRVDYEYPTEDVVVG